MDPRGTARGGGCGGVRASGRRGAGAPPPGAREPDGVTRGAPPTMDGGIQMAVIRWSDAGRSWGSVDGEAPEGLGGAQVGLYEVLMTSASPYALALHADRVAR